MHLPKADNPEHKSHAVRSITTALVALVLIVWAIGAIFWLTKSSPELLRTNSALALGEVATVSPDREICATGQTIPAGTALVEIGLVPLSAQKKPTPGPRTVELSVITPGMTARGRGTATHSEAVSTRIKLSRPTATTTDNGSVCVRGTDRPVKLAGGPLHSGALEFRGERINEPMMVTLNFIAAGEASRFSLIGDILDRASLFRPDWVGPWTFILLLLLVGAGIGTTAWALIARSDDVWSDRRWLLLLAAVALANGLTWIVVTPPFHAPDEYEHFAYVETLAERGLPDADTGAYEQDLRELIDRTVLEIALYPHAKPPWSQSDEDRWREREQQLKDNGLASGDSSAQQYPPVYYGAAALAYKLTPGGVIAKDYGLRLFSLLMTVGSVLLAFMAAREAVPRIAWFAPVVGAIAAFQPMLLHIGSAAHLDSLVILLSCLLIYLVARVFRRGLSLRLSLGIGVVFAAACATKPVSLSFAPALLVAAYFALRSDERPARQGLRDLAVAGATAFVSLLIVYSIFGGSTNVASDVTAGGAERYAPINLTGLLSYSWQWFMPKLDFMQTWYVGDYWSNPPPFFTIVIPGFFANFNHLDTGFPFVVYRVISLICLALLISVVVAAVRNWSRRAEWLPFGAFAAASVVGLTGFLLVSGYLLAAKQNSALIQGRYLLPLVTIFGLFVATGCHNASKRWGASAAIVLVVALALLNLSGYAISLARFYT